MSSDPSQIMTPTASSGGRSGTWRCRRAPGCSTDRACVTASFLADGDPSAPTPWSTTRPVGPAQSSRRSTRPPSRQASSAPAAAACGPTARRRVGRVRATYSAPQALRRLLDDGGRFHHHDGVELEPVGQVHGQQAQRRPEAVAAGVDGLHARRRRARAARSGHQRRRGQDGGGPGATLGRQLGGSLGHDRCGQVVRTSPPRSRAATPGPPHGRGRAQRRRRLGQHRRGHLDHLGRRAVAHGQLDQRGRALAGQMGA